MPNIPPKLNALSFFSFSFFTSRGNSIWNSGPFKLNMIMDYVTFIREHRIHIQINNSHISSEKPPYHWHLEYHTISSSCPEKKQFGPCCMYIISAVARPNGQLRQAGVARGGSGACPPPENFWTLVSRKCDLQRFLGLSVTFFRVNLSGI